MNSDSIIKRTRMLVDVAMGRIPADLVIKDGRWVCVQSGEIVPHTDIAIKSGRIAFVGTDAGNTVDEDTQVVEAEGNYLVPGLLDAHMHVESGMLTVTEFVRAVIPHGTTGMFIDPHEIANVLGVEGIRYMLAASEDQPVNIFFMLPSCVPAVPGEVFRNTTDTSHTSSAAITTSNAPVIARRDGASRNQIQPINSVNTG